MTVGLVCAGAALLAEATTTSWVALTVTLVTAVLLVRTRVHPLFLLAAGTAVGIVAG